MREHVYILADIFNETQTRFTHVTLNKFLVLYSGWRQQGVRHGRSHQFYSAAWKRGWLVPRDAEDFRKYIGLR